jgi:hypothetical protein
VVVEFLQLDADMTTEEVLAFVDRNGFRPALPEETLAACIKNKDAQREAPIVCVGAFWVHPDGYRRALVLDGDSGKRGVDLCWLEPRLRWLWHDRVAIVRKSST